MSKERILAKIRNDAEAFPSTTKHFAECCALRIFQGFATHLAEGPPDFFFGKFKNGERSHGFEQVGGVEFLEQWIIDNG